MGFFFAGVLYLHNTCSGYIQINKRANIFKLRKFNSARLKCENETPQLKLHYHWNRYLMLQVLEESVRFNCCIVEGGSGSAWEDSLTQDVQRIQLLSFCCD